MIEYIFFDTTLRDRFVRHAESLGLACALEDDAMGWTVGIPEPLEDALEEQLEAFYDSLQHDQAEQLAAEGELKRIAGVLFTLPDGTRRQVPLPTDTVLRLLEHFSMEEIETLFSAVATSALQDSTTPLCRALADATR